MRKSNRVRIGGVHGMRTRLCLHMLDGNDFVPMQSYVKHLLHHVFGFGNGRVNLDPQLSGVVDIASSKE